MNDRGQSLLEFLIWLVPIAVMLAMGGSLARIEWNRLQCAYQVFEQTHDRLVGRWPGTHSLRTIQVTIEETREKVHGRGKCGEVTENVILYRLQPQERER